MAGASQGEYAGSNPAPLPDIHRSLEYPLRGRLGRHVFKGIFGLEAVHFPFFGFHSRAIFCACSTWAGVIREPMASRFLAAPSRSLASV